ncbi:hypothetical protein CRUP_014001, partial [Coryphaenoides rupestris]
MDPLNHFTSPHLTSPLVWSGLVRSGLTLDLSNPATFRDLSKPMGAQTEKRREMFVERYEDMDNSDGDMLAHCHYYTHYSSAIIVASFLVRMEPFCNTFQTLQQWQLDAILWRGGATTVGGTERKTKDTNCVLCPAKPRDTNLSSSPIPGSTGSTTGPRTLDTSAVSTTTSAANASTSQDPTSLFVTAQESCMLAGEDQADSWAESSLSHSLETHGKEELAGSYCYASTGVSVAAHGDDQSGVDHPDWSSPNGEFSTLSEDYDSVDHRLQLFLDMEVFEEEEEELHSFLKMSRVRFGQSGECPSLLVVSNQRFYFLEMTSHAHNGQLSDWLQKRDSHPITELSYLEVGLGSQTIHMAFEEGALAYTLLVRDDTRCKSFFSRLTGVVRELAPLLCAVSVTECGEVASCSGAELYLWTTKGHLLSSVDASCGPLGDILCVGFTQRHEWDARNAIVTGSADGVVR